MEMAVDANIQAAALIFASIESKRTGKPIQMQDLYPLVRVNEATQSSSPECIAGTLRRKGRACEIGPVQSSANVSSERRLDKFS